MRERSNSATAVARCSRCRGRIFVKFLRGPDAAQEAARVFAVAAAAHEHLQGDPRFSANRPLHRCGAVLAFEWVDGSSPKPVLRQAPLDEAAALARRLGEWLALFHAGDPRRAAAVEERLAEHCHAVATDWQPGALPPAAARGLQALAARALVRSDQRFVRQHGDAKPDNFLLDGQTVVGIDIAGRHWHLPENDLAQLDVQLRIALLSVAGGLDGRRARRLGDALAAGYASRALLDERTLQTYRWLYLLSFWAGRRTGSPLARWRWDTAFSRLAASL